MLVKGMKILTFSLTIFMSPRQMTKPVELIPKKINHQSGNYQSYTNDYQSLA
jgi:hypothetical protein